MSEGGEVERFGGGSVRRKAVSGGWVVWCRLCGKPAGRSYQASMTNYAEAERASGQYARDHLASSEHAAARDTYNSDQDISRALEQERLLSEVFGIEPASEASLRRREARTASLMEARRVKDENRPKCAVCGGHVSMKADQAEQRVTLPSGAMVHAKCLG